MIIVSVLLSTWTWVNWVSQFYRKIGPVGHCRFSKYRLPIIWADFLTKAYSRHPVPRNIEKILMKKHNLLTGSNNQFRIFEYWTFLNFLTNQIVLNWWNMQFSIIKNKACKTCSKLADECIKLQIRSSGCWICWAPGH